MGFSITNQPFWGSPMAPFMDNPHVPFPGRHLLGRSEMELRNLSRHGWPGRNELVGFTRRQKPSQCLVKMGISPQNMAWKMVLTYLQFRILEFPLIRPRLAMFTLTRLRTRGTDQSSIDHGDFEVESNQENKNDWRKVRKKHHECRRVLYETKHTKQ